MSKLTRVTAKVFGATADGTLADPEIGQFGSAKAGTYNGTGDIATIQDLAAWSNGWIDAVTPTQQFPSLPERTGVDKVLSYQNAYVLQQGIPEWDSGTDYYTNGFCSKNGKIYFSKTDNNLNNDPEADTVNWEEFTSGGATRNIGEIVQSTIPLTDAGLHLLDGALIDGNGIYSAFVDYIADLYDSGDYTDIFDTEANWQTAVTTYGVCGKFVYDSVNNTVRLPKYNSKIYTGGGTAPVKGNGKTLGLTDGTKEGGLHTSGISGYPYFTAGTTAINTNVGTSNTALDLNNNVTVGVTTDGTKSGIIADLANITTSLDGYYYIVIATSTKTDIQVDIDEIATDLNGKVNKSGDTMSGSLRVNSTIKATDGFDLISNAVTKGTNPSSTAYWGIRFNDGSDSSDWKATRLGIMECSLDTSGTTKVQIGAYKNEANATSTSSIILQCTSNGTTYFEFPRCTTKATTTSSAANNKVVVIVENYVNGTSWYRVWSDGWCEQGGYTGVGTVTFLKPFINTNYNITLGLAANSGDAYSCLWNNKTKTSFYFHVGSGRHGDWKASGYIN